MNKYTFPENLKRIRLERGLTQKQLAEIVGTHRNMISWYETGKVYPSLDRVYDIANRLNISVNELLGKNH